MKRVGLSIIVLVLTACSSSPVPWISSGGSKSDATVEMSYIYRPVLDQQPTNRIDALKKAKLHCNQWGYSDAKAFEEVKKSCALQRNNDCVSHRVSITYQCM